MVDHITSVLHVQREAMQLEGQILRELAERERENARMVDGLKKSVAEKEH